MRIHRNARFTCAQTALHVKPWRWPGPDQAVWTWDGLLAWTMVNDRPDSPVTDASTYLVFVGARPDQDLVHVDDAGIAWDWDSRHELQTPASVRLHGPPRSADRRVTTDGRIR